MLAHERHEALKKLLESQGTILVSHLAQEWQVSEMTVRRDLKRLEEQGLLARIHGGAIAGGALRFKARAGKNRSEKATAAAKLVGYLPQEGCIYLDGSTTIWHLVEHLAKRGGLTVVTNNIDTFQHLAQQPGLEVVLIGGRHNADTDNFVGPLAEQTVASLSFHAAFFSAFALHPRFGCAEPSIEDAALKQQVCKRASAVYVAVDHQKLGQQAAGAWTFDHDHALLATDLNERDRRLTPFQALFAEII